MVWGFIGGGGQVVQRRVFMELHFLFIFKFRGVLVWLLEGCGGQVLFTEDTGVLYSFLVKTGVLYSTVNSLFLLREEEGNAEWVYRI